jgi:hypothetical protein
LTICSVVLKSFLIWFDVVSDGFTCTCGGIEAKEKDKKIEEMQRKNVNLFK